MSGVFYSYATSPKPSTAPKPRTGHSQVLGEVEGDGMSQGLLQAQRLLGQRHGTHDGSGCHGCRVGVDAELSHSFG